MRIDGTWFASGSAARIDAALSVEDQYFQLIVDRQCQIEGYLKDISVGERLGNVERKLTFHDGSVFATKDNDAIDLAFEHSKTASGLIHKLESNLAWVLIAVALTVVFGFSFFRWGVPMIGHSVAQVIPQKMGDVIGANTMEFLDDYIFEPSKLKEDRQSAIRNHFTDKLLAEMQVDSEVNYSLHFRAWGEGDKSVANALALPSGDIILTDRFVELSANQAEIDSVLLHEIGHIEHRHTLEMITQSTLVAVVLTVITGDVSAGSDLGIGLGSLLVTTGYSRNFESEADLFAFENMLRMGIDPNSFATIMTKITQDMSGDKKDDEGSDEETSEESNNLIDYLSSHPRTKDRIEQAKRFAQCYRESRVICDAAIIEGQ